MTNQPMQSDWAKMPRAPRRTALYQFIDNRFRYLATALLLLTISLSLVTILTFAQVLILLSLSVVASLLFWRAFELDLSLQNPDNPHKEMWGRLEVLIKPLATFLQNARKGKPLDVIGPDWRNLFIAMILWGFLSMIVFAIYLTQGYDRAGGDNLWVLYIAVVSFAGWQIWKKSSTWFAALWVLSVVTYSVLRLATRSGDQMSVALDTAQQMLFLLYLAGLIHLLLRRLSRFERRAEVVVEVTKHLREYFAFGEAFQGSVNSGEPDTFLSDIALQIAKKLQYEFVYILLRDRNRNRIYLKGANRIPSDNWPREGWAVDEKSITGWVAQHRQEHLCPDTTKCARHMPIKGFPCRAEAAVPILVDDECIGVFDVQATFTNAFVRGDIQVLWQVATAIGTAVAHVRRITRETENAYRLIDETVRELTSARSLDDALRTVVDVTKETFDADVVILFRHAVGNQVPLEGPIIAGELDDPKSLVDKIPLDHRAIHLMLEKNEPYLQSNADSDLMLLGPNNGEYTEEEFRIHGRRLRFIKRERIKSVAYVRLGLGDDIVGSLFINYRNRTRFSGTLQQSLKAFGDVLTLALTLKRKVERLSGALAGPGPLFHTQTQASFELLRREVRELGTEKSGLCGNSIKFENRIDELGSKFNEFQRQWVALMLSEQSATGVYTLSSMVSNLESLLSASHWKFHLTRDINETEEILPLSVHESVFKIVAEAVANALIHGNAHSAHIWARCARDCFLLRVDNDGDSVRPGIVETLRKEQKKSGLGFALGCRKVAWCAF